MCDAVAHARSFNAIHFESVFKVDIFVAGSNEFALSQLNRRQLRRVSPEGEASIYVATAEDTILAKIQSYRAGQETSKSQWNDVLGVLATSRTALDYEYLHTWADKLGVIDLFQKALEDIQDDKEN
jgi:hypothetical protein